MAFAPSAHSNWHSITHLASCQSPNPPTNFSDEPNYDDQGNVKPKREIAVPHRGFSLAVDEEKQEIFVGVHYPPEIAVFPKEASGKDKSIRRLRGESTRLSYVHGMVIDPKQKLMFVANWGRI